MSVRVCRFSLFAAMLTGLTFIVVEQGAEILRCLAEGPAHTGGVRTGRFLCSMLALTLVGLAGWYCSRLLLYLRFPDSPPETDGARRLKLWLPRFIGLAPPLTLGLAFLLAAGPYKHTPSKEVGHVLTGYGFTCFVVAAVLLLGFLKLRQRLGPAVFQNSSWGELTEVRRGIAITALACSSLLFVGLLCSPVALPQFVGSTTILLLAGASWIVYGSFLIYVGHRTRLPVISMLVILALVFSYWNYNHEIRYLKVGQRPQMTDFTDQYSSWYANLRAKYPEEQKPVVIIVAAAGGGIRAAVWTATVLGELQDRNPAFADHVFAISGVSGGSLGAAIFDGLVKSGGTELKGKAQQVLAHDFLSPTLAYLLFPDMLQRVLPYPFPCFDRARALETAWEAGWEATTRNSLFSEDFLSLWRGSSAHNVPCLFLNGTSLETGRRMVLSNVRLDAAFAGVEDVGSHLHAPIALSTAVDMSTRFSFVSPSGRFTTGYHIVDGGYFENSATATACDIVDKIEFIEADYNNRVVPVVIVISNDPNEGEAKPPGSGFLSEALEPLGALLSSREARGLDAEMHLRIQMPKADFFRFSLSSEERSSARGAQASSGSVAGAPPTTKAPLPLGWSLSKLAIEQMNREVANQNETVLELLNRLPPTKAKP